MEWPSLQYCTICGFEGYGEERNATAAKVLQVSEGFLKVYEMLLAFFKMLSLSLRLRCTIFWARTMFHSIV